MSQHLRWKQGQWVAAGQAPPPPAGEHSGDGLLLLQADAPLHVVDLPAAQAITHLSPARVAAAAAAVPLGGADRKRTREPDMNTPAAVSLRRETFEINDFPGLSFTTSLPSLEYCAERLQEGQDNVVVRCPKQYGELATLVHPGPAPAAVGAAGVAGAGPQPAGAPSTEDSGGEPRAAAKRRSLPL
jgi:hypothetical protein